MSDGRRQHRAPVRPVERVTEERREARSTLLPRRPVAPPEQDTRSVQRRPLPDELSSRQRPRAAQPHTTPAHPGGVGSELAATLRNRAALRRAVLLNEILGPPVALRDDEG